MSLKDKIENDNFTGRSLRSLLSMYPYEKWKLGKAFFDYYQLLFKNEKLTYEEVRNYQFTELLRVVNQAYNNTVYYKEKYDAAGFHPSHLKSIEDIKLIPVLTRDEVRNHSENMVDRSFKGKRYKSVTSGTTAKPLTIYRNKVTAQKEWAAICYQWSRIGYEQGEGRIEFRGILPKATTFIHLKHERVLRVNLIEMDSNNVDSIVDAIVKSAYNYIHGYPGSICKFIKLVIAKQGSFPKEFKIRKFMLASENIFDWQLDLIRETFKGATLICHYGQAEKVALGAWNGDENYHFIPSYSITEIKENTLIGTSFISDIMPLIRYEVNDAMNLKSIKHISDKCLYPVVDQIRGRIEDITYTTEGKEVPPALVTFPFKNLKVIESCKITQVGKAEFELLIQTQQTGELLDGELKELMQKMKMIYGNDAHFDYSITDKIPLLKSGKFKWVECKI